MGHSLGNVCLMERDSGGDVWGPGGPRRTVTTEEQMERRRKTGYCAHTHTLPHTDTYTVARTHTHTH